MIELIADPQRIETSNNSFKNELLTFVSKGGMRLHIMWADNVMMKAPEILSEDGTKFFIPNVVISSIRLFANRAQLFVRPGEEECRLFFGEKHRKLCTVFADLIHHNNHFVKGKLTPSNGIRYNKENGTYIYVSSLYVYNPEKGFLLGCSKNNLLDISDQKTGPLF